MKIIHLSDTHVGRNNNGSSNAELVDLIIDDILSLENPSDYLVVHTGDLIDKGNQQYRDLGSSLLARLSDQGVRVLLCPGNHDCGDAMHVDPTIAAQFKAQFAPYIFGQQPTQFPVLNIIDDCAFIGLDSNQAEMSWLDRWLAEGNLGGAQITALSKLLDLPEVRDKVVVLYLHHHPFFDAFVVSADVGDGHLLSHLFSWNTRRFRRLKDAYTLMQCIRDRVDIVLFGHQHFGLDYSAEAQRYGIPTALDASSSTCTEMDTDRMRYRIIDTESGFITTRFVAFPPGHVQA